jgi:ABC-type phosphate transport system substrate-binding protein
MAPGPNRVGSMLAAALACSCVSAGAMAEAVAVVSIKAPLTALTKSQVADIFLGKVARFPDGSAAVPIDQAEGSPAREEFYLAFTGKSPSQLNAHWSKIIFTGRGQPPAEVADAAEVKRRLAANPNAIGYVDAALVDATLRIVSAP